MCIHLLAGARIKVSNFSPPWENPLFSAEIITTAVSRDRCGQQVNTGLSVSAGTTGREKSRTPVKSWWWAQNRLLLRRQRHRAQLWDVAVVAAGENKDLQGPAGHRLREVRGSFYIILTSPDKNVACFTVFFGLNFKSTFKLRPRSWFIKHLQWWTNGTLPLLSAVSLHL